MNSAPAALTCRAFTDFLADYLAGDLGPETRSVFDRHLSECPPCQSYLTSYAEAIRLSRDAFAGESLPDDVPPKLVEAILAAVRGREG